MFVKKDALGRLFLRPWTGLYAARSLRPTWMWEGRVTQEQLPRWRCGECTLITLLFLITPTLATATSTSCPDTPIDEISQVRYIHDGDTLHLVDGRKIRLIGINTPELARDNKPAEPFANKSTKALKSLFKKDKSIALIFGKDKKDRYGRFLAHAFLADGTNVQTTILKQGLASAISIPPNTRFTACYLENERFARCNKAGLWASNTIIEARNLQKKHIGFHLIKGTVKSIKTNRGGTWLTLNNRLTIGIRPKEQDLFDLQTINKLLNQTIIVRGWLNKSSKSTPFYLRVRHPLSIQLASSYACH